jgi:hypothetical protein
VEGETVVVLDPSWTPGTELEVVGLWCVPAVVEGTVSLGRVGTVVTVEPGEDGGAVEAGGRTVVVVGAVVVGTVVVVVPLWVMVMLSPGASPFPTSLTAFAVLEAEEDDAPVFTSNQSAPRPRNRMAMTAVDHRIRRRVDIGRLRAANTPVSFIAVSPSQ